jgi:bifunctional DNA-binding transcriptional regulator/antitoxin component of YhaV-PrlF toxin-antitoxin module
MAITLKITAKGQITLYREVLRHLGITPGEIVVVDLLPAGRVALWAAKGRDSIEDFFGCLEWPAAKALSIEEIAEIAAQGWSGRR